MVILLELILSVVLEQKPYSFYSDIAGFKFWIPVSIVNFGYTPLSSSFIINT